MNYPDFELSPNLTDSLQMEILLSIFYLQRMCLSSSANKHSTSAYNFQFTHTLILRKENDFIDDDGEVPSTVVIRSKQTACTLEKLLVHISNTKNNTRNDWLPIHTKCYVLYKK